MAFSTPLKMQDFKRKKEAQNYDSLALECEQNIS